MRSLRPHHALSILIVLFGGLALGSCAGEETVPFETTGVRGPFATSEPLQRGVNFACWQRYCYGNLEVRPSIDTLDAHFVSHAAAMFTIYNQTNTSSQVERDSFLTQDDLNMLLLRSYADPHGIEWMLKVMVEVRDGSWQGDIDPGDREAWFRSFRDIAVHYGKVAERYGVELLCIGNELVRLENETEEWRALARAVRGVYSGKLTYAGNWATFHQLEFWDVMDYVGVNAYFPLSDSSSPGVDQLVENWEPWIGSMENAAAEFQRPILITEIGYSSTLGSSATPYIQYPSPFTRITEQTDTYEAAFRVLPGKPWLAGIYWWYWQADDIHWGGYQDKGYSPQNKPAAELIRKNYREIRERLPAP